MTTTEEIARLQGEAQRAERAAREAAEQLRAQQAAADSMRDARRREWAQRYVEDFDRQALRDRTREAHAELVAALEADPVGQALARYLTAALTEHRRLAHHDWAADVARLDGPRYAQDTTRPPHDARGAIDDPHTWAAGTLARAIGDLALEAADHVEQDFQDSLDRYIHDDGAIPAAEPRDLHEQGYRERLAAHEAHLRELGVESLSSPAEEMTEDDRQRLGLPRSTTRRVER